MLKSLLIKLILDISFQRAPKTSPTDEGVHVEREVITERRGTDSVLYCINVIDVFLLLKL
jgi:hypothetical protein